MGLLQDHDKTTTGQNPLQDGTTTGQNHDRTDPQRAVAVLDHF